ncbi:probable G-protein coupled receptor 141 [Salvelinus namaycush]|uniref:Probable G-protein coupled receptor 141 n=1 Tax=Salvelinus namaycush TaxID=8040 RepID=A0A8U0P6P8_SALNM|nr:probable G-protein coupled receptor 141 [Salvelinus namaycush]
MGNGTNVNNAMSKSYRYALLSIYTIVLVGGTISMSLMINIIKSNVRSVTTTAVLNLIVVHFVFLLTVPFRLYFYAAGEWHLGPNFCKVVSAMIHAHMYLAFVFYVIILVIRYLSFFRRFNQVEFYRRLHALGASAAVWGLMLIVVVPLTAVKYGSSTDNNTTTNDNQCFNFGGIFDEKHTVAVLNYIICALIIVVTLALACCQVWILGCVYRTHRAMIFSQQEFWAQIKSLCFMLVIIVCFVPYNVFRIYYVSNYNVSLQMKNEFALAVTTFSCFDMLTFIGRGSFRPCDTTCCVS